MKNTKAENKLINSRNFWLAFPLASILIGGIAVSLPPNIEAKEIELMQVKNSSNCSQVTLTGIVIRKPWAKTSESWMAGGSDYYVLDVGEAEIEERSAAEGVILRPSEQIPFDSFEEYVGRPVEVEGEYVAARPYIPENPFETYPTDMNGEPLPRGAGFQVCAIAPG